jgi:hypothetical protein
LPAPACGSAWFAESDEQASTEVTEVEIVRRTPLIGRITGIGP